MLAYGFQLVHKGLTSGDHNTTHSVGRHVSALTEQADEIYMFRSTFLS